MDFVIDFASVFISFDVGLNQGRAEGGGTVPSKVIWGELSPIKVSSDLVYFRN